MHVERSTDTPVSQQQPMPEKYSWIVQGHARYAGNRHRIPVGKLNRTWRVWGLRTLSTLDVCRKTTMSFHGKAIKANLPVLPSTCKFRFSVVRGLEKKTVKRGGRDRGLAHSTLPTIIRVRRHAQLCSLYGGRGRGVDKIKHVEKGWAREIKPDMFFCLHTSRGRGKRHPLETWDYWTTGVRVRIELRNSAARPWVTHWPEIVQKSKPEVGKANDLDSL